MSSNASNGTSVVGNSVRTDDAHHEDEFTIVYPDIQTSLVITLLQVFGASLIAIFLAQRVRLDDFRSLHALKQISLPRLYLALLFLHSWIFFVTSAVLIQGIGLDLSHESCEAGIITCIALYSASKSFVYLFLGERVHIVWYPTLTTPRYKSPLYLLSLLFVIAYLAVVCYLFAVHIDTLHRHGQCLVGLKLSGVILLMVFDVIISGLMTFLFVWPLIRNSFRHSHLRYIARRSVTAAIIALSVSCVNITFLAVRGGMEDGWLCLLCWEGDVLISAIVFFWLTAGSGLRPIASQIAEAKARSTSHSSPRRSRTWLRRTFSNTTVSTLMDLRPDSRRRQSSLPTIMTHGMLDEHDISTFVTLPKSALTNDQKWPAFVGIQRAAQQYGARSDLSIAVISTEKDAEPIRLSSYPYTPDGSSS